MIKSKKIFLIIVASIVVMAAASGGAVYFSDQSLQQQAQEISDLKADQAILDEQIQIYRNDKSKVEELAFIDDVANQVLPQNKEQSTVIAEIYTFADQIGLQIGSLDFGGAGSMGSADLDVSQTTTVTGLTGVRVLPTNVTIEGGSADPNLKATYTKLLAFLRKIEVNRRKMQVVGLDLTPSTENRNELTSISLTINIYLKG